jgi:hypothetical protein
MLLGRPQFRERLTRGTLATARGARYYVVVVACAAAMRLGVIPSHQGPDAQSVAPDLDVVISGSGTSVFMIPLSWLSQGFGHAPQQRASSTPKHAGTLERCQGPHK